VDAQALCRARGATTVSGWYEGHDADHGAATQSRSSDRQGRLRFLPGRQVGC